MRGVTWNSMVCGVTKSDPHGHGSATEQQQQKVIIEAGKGLATILDSISSMQ